MANRSPFTLHWIKKFFSENYEALLALIAGGGGALPYKVYTAIIMQSGTGAPTADILQNTLGAVPVWSRSGIGDYRLTLAGVFTEDKTAVFITNGAALEHIAGRRISDDQVNVFSGNDNLIIFATVEIRVYD